VARSVRDIAGETFGSLAVLRSVPGGRRIRYAVRCSCGVEFEIDKRHILNSGVRSCRSCSRMTHGHTRGGKSAAYSSWASMIGRCETPSAGGYKNYGGRGIRVCARWHSFEDFLADMGEPPYRMSIDRFPNKDGDYGPDNCRWATQSQQMRNTRNTRLTAEIARIALDRMIGGETMQAVANSLGVTLGCVMSLRYGGSWRDLNSPWKR
jgi:hypothetical protein